MGTGHDPSVREACAASVPLTIKNHLQVAEYIAEGARILDKSGLKYQVRTLSRPCLELFG